MGALFSGAKIPGFKDRQKDLDRQKRAEQKRLASEQEEIAARQRQRDAAKAGASGRRSLITNKNLTPVAANAPGSNTNLGG